MRSLRESSSAKAVLGLLALTTFVWGTFMFVVVPVEAAQRHTDGSIILDGGTVYKIENGMRRGFTSAEMFFSHGYNFSGLMGATDGDRALPMGTAMTWANGTLVNDGGTVYIVNEGVRRGFTSAAVFNGLGFSFAHLRVGSTSGFTDGAVVNSSTAAHPGGTLVLSGGTVWWISNSGRSGVPSMDVFNSYGWSFARVVPGNASDLALTALANVTARVNGGSLVDDGTTTPPTSSTGTLFVSLAADTPASGAVIAGGARVPFTKVNLTASGGDVIVDTWAVERTGVAQDAAFSSVDVIDLAINSSINESGKSFSTDHVANFSEDLTIKNGETKSVMLAGNMTTGSTHNGATPRLSLKSITVKGNASSSGSFPLEGNAMTINSSITLDTPNVARGAYSNATSSALEVGKLAYTFLSFQIGAESTEHVLFTQVKVHNSGSASLTSDLANIKLYKDGTFLANGVVSGNYVNFQVNDTITKGQTSQYLVQADVISGSARTVKLGIWRATDIYVKGTTYNTGLTPGFSGTGFSASSPVLQDNEATISTGTLRVGKSNTVASVNITVGSDQVLGAFEFEAKGEPVNVTALTLTVASTTSGTITEDALTSVKLVNANGVTVAGPTDVTNNALTVAWTDTFTVPVGLNHYKVMGTLATGGGWATNDTITVSINTPASKVTARGDNTGQSITATPSSNTAANQQTVKAAGVTVTKNSTPTNKSVVAGSTGVLAGSWQFDATNAGEDVRITALAIRASTTGKFNTLTLKRGTVGSDTALSPVNDNPVTSNNANTTSTFAFSSPIVITKGSSENINLYVNVPSSVNAGEVDAFGITTGAAVTAYGVGTGNTATVTVTAHNGALLTAAAAGTLTTDVHSDNLASRQVVHGSTGVSLAEVKLTATNESIDVTKLTVGAVDGALTGTAAGTNTEIAKLYLKLNGTLIGNTAGYTLGSTNTAINFQRGGLTVPEGTTGVKLSLVADIVNIGTNQPGTANADIKVGLNGANGTTAVGNGSNGSVTETYSNSTGSAVILHRSMPSVVTKAPVNNLAASAAIHRTEISAIGNDIGVYRLSFVTVTSTGVNLTDGYLKLNSCSPSCGGIADNSQLSAVVALGTDITAIGTGGIKTWGFIVDPNQSHAKQYLQIAAGATAIVDFFATVGLSSNVDSVSTSLLGDTATTTGETQGDKAAEFTVNNQGNFVWSDLNSASTQAAATLTTQQWYNGYYVKGLGATATTTSVVVSE